jgi:hypothetical protein
VCDPVFPIQNSATFSRSTWGGVAWGVAARSREWGLAAEPMDVGCVVLANALVGVRGRSGHPSAPPRLGRLYHGKPSGNRRDIGYHGIDPASAWSFHGEFPDVGLDTHEQAGRSGGVAPSGSTRDPSGAASNYLFNRSGLACGFPDVLPRARDQAGRSGWHANPDRIDPFGPIFGFGPNLRRLSQ